MRGTGEVRDVVPTRIGPPLFGCLCCACCCACSRRSLRCPAGAFIHLERFEVCLIWRDLSLCSLRAVFPHASGDLMGSLLLLPSLCPGVAFCALLLTTGTGKSLRRFVLDTSGQGAALLSVAWYVLGCAAARVTQLTVVW
jgi:hypothetical protein